jgi:hypothetical protein
MTISSPHAVTAGRMLATWIVRAAGVILLGVGTYLALKRVYLGVGTGNFQLIHRIWSDDGDMQSFYRGLAMITVGSALCLLSSRIARWVVVLPARACPGCTYDLPDPAPDRCPECGLPGLGSGADNAES